MQHSPRVDRIATTLEAAQVLAGSPITQETVVGASGPDAFLGSLLFQHAGTVGVLLIGSMLLVVCWRAARRRPVTIAEVLVGIVGFIALLLPLALPTGSITPGARAETGVSAEHVDFAASIAELRTRVVALEEAARALQAQIAAIAIAVQPPAADGVIGPPAPQRPNVEQIRYRPPASL